jgi:ELWxxDGT repeat protein
LLAATPTKVYFRATDGTYGDELWVTDGTIAGTLRLSDFVVGAGGTPFSGVSVVGDGILFQYCTCNNWVWGVSDGTVAGTHALDINTPTSVGNLGVVGNRVVFSSKDSREGTEMFSWSSVTGVTSSLEINPHTGSEPSYLVSDGTTAVFTANGGEHGNETWITDGTSAGTFYPVAVMLIRFSLLTEPCISVLSILHTAVRFGKPMALPTERFW